MPGSCWSTQSSTLHFRKCYQMYTCFLFAANSWSWKCVDSYSLFKGCTSWVESFSIYSGFIKVHDSTGSCIVLFWSTHSTPYSLIHTALSSILKCFLFAIRQHSYWDGCTRTQLGDNILHKDFGMQIGAARNWTTNFLLSRWALTSWATAQRTWLSEEAYITVCSGVGNPQLQSVFDLCYFFYCSFKLEDYCDLEI